MSISFKFIDSRERGGGGSNHRHEVPRRTSLLQGKLIDNFYNPKFKGKTFKFIDIKGMSYI